MGQAGEKSKEASLLKTLRAKRDAGMEKWAKVTLRITSSDAYQRATGALGKPGLILSAIARQKAEAAMAQILSHVNMPSRSDVLSLSVRLTHIETALDDLGAALDEMRATAARARPATPSPAKPAPAKRAAGHRAARATAAGQG